MLAVAAPRVPSVSQPVSSSENVVVQSPRLPDLTNLLHDTGVEYSTLQKAIYFFIDQKDHEVAREAIATYYNIPLSKTDPYLYQFYTDAAINREKVASDPDDFVFFFKTLLALPVLAREISVITPELFLALNSAVTTGEVMRYGERLRHNKVSEVVRSQRDFTEVFDEQGRYKDGLSRGRVPIGGFARMQDLELIVKIPFDLHPGRESFKATVDDLVIESFRRKIFAQYARVPKGTNAVNRLEEVTTDYLDKICSTYLRCSPHLLKFLPNENRYLKLFFCISRDELEGSLDKLCAYLHRRSVNIAEHVSCGNLKAGCESYVAKVCRLAAIVARSLDMHHFAVDGNGRTSLLVERLILMRFGITVEGSIAGFHRRMARDSFGRPRAEIIPRENGTYCTLEERVEALSAAVSQTTLCQKKCFRSCLDLLNKASAAGSLHYACEGFEHTLNSFLNTDEK